mgnify:CR=1 FL=1
MAITQVTIAVGEHIKINNHELFYDHFVDQKDQNKWKTNYKLKKTDLNILPHYIRENKLKLKDWIV